MSSSLETTIVHPFTDDTPFAYGEHTVLQLRSQPFQVPAQPFQVEDELGTVVTMPLDTNVRAPLAAVPSGDDAILRMEAKLDAALRQIEKLQQRIESLDLTLARALSR